MEEAQSPTLTERQRYWLEHIRACEASGNSIAVYTAEHGLAARAMYGGKKALIKKGVLPQVQPSRFQRAQVVGSVTNREWRIDLPNGVSVTFSGRVDAGALSTVLTTAAALG
ncbi:MAG: hypothetical protein AB2806_12470 [Candidatus Thiodiazotropha sp.]